MKKRIVALLLTAAMCAGLLAGCGKSSDTAATGGRCSGGRKRTVCPDG